MSSQAADEAHKVLPLEYAGEARAAREALVAVLGSLARVTVVTKTENYIHAEARSALFRFVDDVEFLFDDATNTIHVRSASRLGYSDLGVNRKRVETIRAAFYRRLGGRGSELSP